MIILLYVFLFFFEQILTPDFVQILLSFTPDLNQNIIFAFR